MLTYATAAAVARASSAAVSNACQQQVKHVSSK